jgi:hypothetical protein
MVGATGKKNMPKAIARIAKLKGGNLAASEQHTKRQRETPNANPEVKNIRFIGQPDAANGPTLETLVRQRIGDQTIRKNAVLCVEMVLTASPEYFRPDDPGRAGYYHPQHLEAFKHSVHNWLDEKYGDRIVRAELHLDEATPHIHAYLVPLDEKGKLNCRGLFGGRQKLSKFQDSFALAMAPLGLERGIKGSRATHTEVKEYYAAVTQPPDLTLDTATIHHQLADRQRVLKESAEKERTAKALAQEVERLNWRILQLEVKADAESLQAQVWKNRYQDLANQVRDIPLEQVAYELGLDPDPMDKHKWENPDHIINITGSKFYDWKELKGGGGAIDLVMRINDCNFKQAVAWLNDRVGESATLTAATYHTREIIRTEPLRQFVKPVENESHWDRVRGYLTRERRLPSAVVDALHQRGLIYADDQQNLVSIRRDLSGKTITGASLRGTVGTDNKFKGLARGSKRSDGWFYFERGGQSGDPIQRAVLVESPIDAMSFAVLDRTESRKTLYLSTDGAGAVPVEFLQKLPAQSVIVAYDNDQDGNLMAQRVITQLPNSVRRLPQAKDWNEELKNTFNLSATRRQNSTSQQQKPSHNHGRGMSL